MHWLAPSLYVSFSWMLILDHFAQKVVTKQVFPSNSHLEFDLLEMRRKIKIFLIDTHLFIYVRLFTEWNIGTP